MNLNEEMKLKIPKEFLELLSHRNGAATLAEELPKKFLPEQISEANEEQRIWELIGLYYLNRQRYWEAILIFTALYEHMLEVQLKGRVWVHKGMPLVWIRDCYYRMGFPVLSKRYQMLTLCEDAISGKGNINAEKGGVYFRLVWEQGLPDYELKRYATEINELRINNKMDSLFPEWILLELDQNWMTEFPTDQREAAIYHTHKKYIQYLLSKLDNDSRGTVLEQLAEYILACMPGCRTYKRSRTKSTDYDIICSMEGLEVDFRSELGRYFICECKNLKDNPADFTDFSKFCQVLDSIKSKFGIIFSPTGISGSGKLRDAEREQLKVFQSKGMVIVVINGNDIDSILEGKNFINLLRKKYERIRLDLDVSYEH